jgi:poly [ADP-ribose] polymerase
MYRKWGRVHGNRKPSEQTKTFPDAKREALKVMRAKLKDGYKEIEIVNSSAGFSGNKSVNVEKAAIEQIVKDQNPDVKDLITYLSKTNIHNILSKTDLSYDEKTGLFSTPLGLIGLNSINNARNILAEIQRLLILKKDNSPMWVNLCEDYLMIIPHEMGHRFNVKSLFGTEQKINSEYEILNNLESSLSLAEDSMHDKIKDEKLFDIDMSVVTDPKVIDYVKQKYQRNIDSSHPSSKLKVARVFDLKINSMHTEYEKVEEAIGNKRKLWHGTRVGNLLSILHKGMIIQSENDKTVTARMFGHGLYFSDVSTKSLNYSYGIWNKVGAGNENRYYALICNVLLGKEYPADQTFKGGFYPVKGYDSTVAKKGTLNLRNNEMIVYNTNQVSPRYLVEFTK